MKSKQLTFKKNFKVELISRHSQAASMTLQPGGSEGGKGNFHCGSDQWLFVVGGKGNAVVNGKKKNIKTGSLLLIPKKARHQINNTGTTPLQTLNFYVPNAYTKRGDELPAGKNIK